MQTTSLGTKSRADSDEDTAYDLYIKCDGSCVTVYQGLHNGAMTQVLSGTTNVTTTVKFGVWADGDYDSWVDNYTVLDETGDTVQTVLYTYDNANQLTDMVSSGLQYLSLDFTYDDWGRMVSKYSGSYDATYTYAYASKLATVTTDFPGESDATYEYGGDGKRRWRIVDPNGTPGKMW